MFFFGILILAKVIQGFAAYIKDEIINLEQHLFYSQSEILEHLQ